MKCLIALLSIAVLAAGCSPKRTGNGGDDGSGSASGSASGSDGSGAACAGGACAATCDDANQSHASIGCEYYAVDMDGAQGPPYDACYVVFVANVSMDPVHIAVDWSGTPVDMSTYAKLPSGAGQSLTYGAYDPTAGLAPGKVAILFLDYGNGSLSDLGNVPCPVPAALGSGVQVHGTGTGTAFHITTDSPVVAYQMLPYGGGYAETTGASLLIPTSAWQTNYIAVSAWDDIGSDAFPLNISQGPSHDVVAMQDNTTVTIRPLSAILAGGTLPAGTANTPYQVTLNAGEYAQVTQTAPLSGSPITSDKPIGVFGGHQILFVDRCCGDHGEQMLTPVSALGSEYVAAPHGDREPAGVVDTRVFHIYGAVDGTQLTYDPPGAGPPTVNQGAMVEIRSTGALDVRSQDNDHPFAMFTYMSGAGEPDDTQSDWDPNWVGGWGDADFVRLVPPAQYLSHYVFFTDPTYPFTVLTVVRQQSMGTFADVTLDCLGTIPTSDWQPVGNSGNYQIAYVKLVDHWMSQSGCNNGVHVMDSATPFGVWVWGWGSDDTNTGWVSYGYPAGEGVLPINNVVIQ